MDCLVDEYGELARESHQGNAPGAARDESCPLDSSPLACQMPLLYSREGTYESLLVALARIFQRWTRRGFMNEGDNFCRGLSHLLILGGSGSGVLL